MKKSSTLIIASCLIGLIAASVYSSRIRHLRDEISRLSERIPVLTVTRDINAGESLALEDLADTQLISEQVSSRTISPEDLSLILGRHVIHPIPAGDPVLWTDFPEGPRVRYPSEKIPPGYRVIALAADETHTLVHFITPGDAVDIVSSTFDVSKSRLVTRVIARRVTVIGIGRHLEGISDGPDTDDFPLSVSLLVDPETAVTILGASQSGQIHFLACGSTPFDGVYDHGAGIAPDKDLRGQRP